MIVNKRSDRSMELRALTGKLLTDRPTHRLTDRQGHREVSLPLRSPKEMVNTLNNLG